MGYKQQVSGAGLDGQPGFRIRRPSAPHRTTMPSWESETQFRAFPAPKPDGSGFYPMRESIEDNDFGPAVWSEPIVSRLGVVDQFTYPVRIPGGDGDDPTTLAIKALLALIDEKPKELIQRGLDWLSWPKGGKGKGARLKLPSRGILMQGATIMAGGKVMVNQSGTPTPVYPSLLMGTVSMRLSFESLGCKRVDGYSGPDPSIITGTDEASRQQLDSIYANMFALGDWCSLEHGRIMRIYQAPPTPGGFSKPHYAVDMGSEFSLAAAPDIVTRNWLPWEDLIWYHTAEEHVQLLCRAFPPEAVDYALSGSQYERLLPANVKGAWDASARVAQFPGAQFPQAPQMPVAPQMLAAPQLPQALYQPPAGTGVPLPQQMITGTPAPQFQQMPQMTQMPAAPQLPVQPAQVPQTAGMPPMPTDANAGLMLNGMNMGGGGDFPPAAPAASIPSAANFGQVPELQQIPQMPVAPQLPQQQASVPMATPPASAGAVPNDKLADALAKLKAAQQQNAAGGNPAGQ